MMSRYKQALAENGALREKLKNCEDLKKRIKHTLDNHPSELSAKAWLLRKQAEAVEAFGQGIVSGTAMNDDFEDGDFCADDILVMAQSEANRLRRQADQLEKGGE